MKRTRSIICYIFVIIFSVLFLYLGNKIMSKSVMNGMVTDRETRMDNVVFAKIISINNTVRDENDMSKNIYFTAKTVWSQKNGEVISASQTLYDNSVNRLKEISKGDTVILSPIDSNENTTWVFQDYFRLHNIIILGLILCFFVLVLGRLKGLHTLVSLTFTCLSIFLLFIPSIGAGVNIYLSCIVICIYIICMTILILIGFNKKALSAILGCTGGIIVSEAIAKIFGEIIKLTGYINEDTYLLADLFGTQTIDMKAIVFAMTTIGVLGATMDVSISITSSVYEICSNNREIKKYQIIKSGLNIGRDIMGTMINTLILAYIGSSLLTVLLYYGAHYPLLSLLNREEIIVEFMQSLIGSLGMVFTIPLTTVVSAFLLTNKPKQKQLV